MAERSRRLEVWGEASNRGNAVRLDHAGGSGLRPRCVGAPRPDVKRRKKKLSKAVYGASHTLSLAEARYVYGQGEGAERLIIGGGQSARVELSAEAAEYLARKRCEVVLVPTPEVIASWNEATGRVIGLFHVTC